MNELLVPLKRASISRICRYQGLTMSTLLRHMYVNNAHLSTFVYIWVNRPARHPLNNNACGSDCFPVITLPVPIHCAVQIPATTFCCVQFRARRLTPISVDVLIILEQDEAERGRSRMTSPMLAHVHQCDQYKGPCHNAILSALLVVINIISTCYHNPLLHTLRFNGSKPLFQSCNE